MQLADFKGAWTVARVIEDHAAAPNARFDGRAVFSAAPDGLRYEEQGQLSVPGQPPFQASRVYLWQQDADGITVYFEDGRLFHQIDAGTSPEAVHDCPPDVYRVRYDFGEWPDVWQARWRVTGPRKDYTMVSRYQRVET